MKRRDFLAKAGAGAVAGGTLAACGENTQRQAGAADTRVFKWKMVTTWPQNFPVLGTGAEHLAKLIGKLSNGRLQVKLYAAG